MTARNASLGRDISVTCVVGEDFIDRSTDLRVPGSPTAADRTPSNLARNIIAKTRLRSAARANPAAGSVAQKVRAEIMVMQRARGDGDGERGGKERREFGVDQE